MLPPALPRRFIGSKVLPTDRISSHFSKIHDEVLEHLMHLPGAKVTVRVDIEVSVPDGIPDDKQRVIKENATSLKFSAAEFEG